MLLLCWFYVAPLPLFVTHYTQQLLPYYARHFPSHPHANNRGGGGGGCQRLSYATLNVLFNPFH